MEIWNKVPGVRDVFRCNKKVILCAVLLCCILLTGCGQDEELTAYQDDMKTFFEHFASYHEGMNAIDASAEDSKIQLLSYLDQLQAEFTWMAELTVPDQFSAVDSLADGADENMKQAGGRLHRAYEAGGFDEPTGQAGRGDYDMAEIRVQVYIAFLPGGVP